jgi:hypothetical protein
VGFVDAHRGVAECPSVRSISSVLGFAAVLVCACSGGADDDEPEDFECSVLSRMGTYLMTLTEVDGTCGPFPASVVRLSSELEPGCVLDRPTTVSPDECSVETSITCTDEFGVTVTGDGITKQANADGSLITGILTMHIKDATGPICLSTYRAKYERQ